MPNTPHSSRGPSRSGTSKRASVTCGRGVSTSGDRGRGQEFSPQAEGSSGHGGARPLEPSGLLLLAPLDEFDRELVGGRHTGNPCRDEVNEDLDLHVALPLLLDLLLELLRG